MAARAFGGPGSPPAGASLVLDRYLADAAQHPRPADRLPGRENGATVLAGRPAQSADDFASAASSTNLHDHASRGTVGFEIVFPAKIVVIHSRNIWYPRVESRHLQIPVHVKPTERRIVPNRIGSREPVSGSRLFSRLRDVRHRTRGRSVRGHAIGCQGDQSCCIRRG
jgi:hypothetical protein